LRRAIILGSGGHSRALISILHDIGIYKISGIFDINGAREGESVLGYQVLGVPLDLGSWSIGADTDFFLAIGKNSLRRIWWFKIKSLGFSLPNLISPYAHIDRFAKLGEGNIICAKAFIGPEASIGDNNLINTGAIIEHEVCVGNNCHIAPSSTIAGRSCIGDDSFIGAGSTIIDSTFVANGTTLGAGAVLVETIEAPQGVYIGVPAKRVRESG
jgi:UDP-N-acetylbacillosamine N-acetyltransferase